MQDGLDLGFDDAQQAVAAALAQFCRERLDAGSLQRLEPEFDRGLWSELAGLGVLALATPEGDGGVLELVAACESLGAAVFPGPLPATFFATQLLAADERRHVASGDWLVSLGSGGLMPFAAQADLFLEIEGERVQRVRPRGAIAPVATLGGEPWGRIDVEPVEPFHDTAAAFVVEAIATAACLAAAGRALIERTADHARVRKQFGRPIGDFQAVAHPLADCAVALDASATLARAAAAQSDAGESAAARATAAAARVAAVKSAVASAHVAHQLFGALGITLEGPVFHVARRIRQLASQMPGDRFARAVLLQEAGL